MSIYLARRFWVNCVVCVTLAVSAFGCRTANQTEAGALAGAGFGGTLGALIGSQSGRGGTGAVLGAMTGAVVGGLAGEAADARDERDAAIAQAQYERDQSARNAVTNFDLINMSQAGLSDQVVINSVQTRGGQFDLSPSAIIELKSRGVSDNVILSIQQSSQRGSYRSVSSVVSRPTTIVSAPPTIYYIRPAPTYGVYFGSRPHYHRPHYHYGSCW